MGVQKLRTKLRLDTGKDVSMEETEVLVRAHKTVFSRYWEWVYELTKGYKNSNPLCTNDGWVLFCDNPSIPSVRNFLVQGNAASITRRAVVLMIEAGLDVRCSLHDAVYVVCKEYHEGITTISMEKYMHQATCEILKEDKTNIRIDFKTITNKEVWVEDKSLKDIKKLAPFLELKEKDGKYSFIS